MRYQEDFQISLEPRTLIWLVDRLYAGPYPDDVVRAEAQNFACEIRARLQKLGVDPDVKQVTSHRLALQLATAVSADENTEGCDLSAGLFGIHVSNWLRSLAGEPTVGADPPAHICGNPNAMCDTECVERSYESAKPYGEGLYEHPVATAAIENVKSVPADDWLS